MWLYGRAVLAGHLLYVEMHPNPKFGNPHVWKNSLDTLLAWDFETVVLGHGALGQRGDVRHQRALLAELVDKLTAFAELTPGQVPEALRRANSLSPA